MNTFLRLGFSTLSVAAAAALLSGSTCQNTPAPVDDTPVRTQVENVAPVASVGGQVRNFRDGTVASGVTVALHAGAYNATDTTDAEGLFDFADVPAGGTAVVTLTNTMFHEARLTVVLDDAAGNFPSRNNHVFVGPVYMVPFGGTPLAVEVLRHDGQPVGGVNVVLDLAAAYVLQGAAGFEARGNIREAVATAPEGRASFNVMPDPALLAAHFPTLNVSLTVAAVAGVGTNPGSQGAVFVRSLRDLVEDGNTVRVVLPPLGTETELKILAAALPDLVTGARVQLPGWVSPTTLNASNEEVPTQLRVVFNQPVVLPSVEAALVTEDGESLTGPGPVTRMAVVVPGSTDADGGVAGIGSVLDLVVPALIRGTEANLFLRASAAAGQGLLNVAAPLYIEQNAAVSINALRRTLVSGVADGVLGPNEEAEIVLNMPLGARDLNGAPVPSGQLLPCTVTLQLGASTARATGRLTEPTPPAPYRAGGFTTRVRFTLPAGSPTFGRTQVTVRVDFNDAAARDGGPVLVGPQYTAVTPEGGRVIQAAGGVPLTLLQEEPIQ
jgi:hypothetical protein